MRRIDSQTIVDIEDWAKTLLGITDSHMRLYPTVDVRVAQTLVALGADENNEEAENRCELAQHRTPSYFEATLCLYHIL